MTTFSPGTQVRLKTNPDRVFKFVEAYPVHPAVEAYHEVWASLISDTGHIAHWKINQLEEVKDG